MNWFGKDIKFFEKLITDLVYTRNQQGRNIQADILMCGHSTDYILRLYDRETRAIKRVDLSFNLVQSESQEIIEQIINAFDTYPFNKPSPLEKIL